jgi:hypothetical protein
MPITFLTTQGNGGTAVPYTRRNLEGTHTTELTHSPQDSIRLARIEEGWRFYLGSHWSFSREDGDPLVTANYARAVVDKKASWLVGNDMTLSVPDAFVKKTKPVLEEVWKYNGGKAHLLRMAKMGGVTGDVNVLVTYQEPTSKQLAINPHTRGSIRLRLLGSHQVFPTWDPLNQEKLKSLKIITHVDDPSAPTPRENDAARSASAPTSDSTLCAETASTRAHKGSPAYNRTPDAPWTRPGADARPLSKCPFVPTMSNRGSKQQCP